MNGRQYFAQWEREYKVAGVAPDVIQEGEPSVDLKRGPVESKLGGRITRDLKRLPPESTAERHDLSEGFLKQPVERVPAESDE